MRVDEANTKDQVAEPTRSSRHPPGADIPILAFEHVFYSSWGETILRDVSFSLMKGETKILLGLSGSGKSLLLKLADGLVRPDSGCIRLFNEDIVVMSEQRLLPLRGGIGMLFQEDALFDSLSVRDNIGYKLIEARVPGAEVDQRVEEVLKFVDLSGSEASFPSDLSGGMRRRVAFARAILNHPNLLLYDSPTGGLDPVTAATIIDLIIKQRDTMTSSCLMVTERIQDAYRISTHHFNDKSNEVEALPAGQEDQSTRFLFLQRGTIPLYGSIFDLLASRDTVIREFLT